MKLTFQLGALSMSNIAVAFLFQWYVLTQLGLGVETDAFFAGMTVPQLVLAVISGSLMHVLVPLLAGESDDRLRCDAWGFLFLVGGLFGVSALGLYVAAPWWVPLTVPGFDVQGQVLTTDLTRIQLIGMVFTAINGVQLAAYHARQRFVWAELSPNLAGVIALLLLAWALPRFGIVAAAWISTLRMALLSLFLVRGMGRPAFPDLKNVAVRQAWQRIKPLLLGTAYYKTDPLVDRFLLSTVASGSLSLYYLAQQIYGAASQVLNKAVVAPLVPALSRLHKSGDKNGYRRVYYRRLTLVAAGSLAGLLVLGFSGQKMLDWLVGHGNVTSTNVAQLWWMMIWLGGVFVGGNAGQICASSFYAHGDTVTPTRMSMLTYTAYVPGKILAFWLWGIVGLAIVTSFYYVTNFLFQIYLLEKKWPFEYAEARRV